MAGPVAGAPQTPTPQGLFGTLQEWITAAAEFTWQNLALVLFIVWCFILFAATEWAKGLVERFISKKEDQELVNTSMPPVLGAITGYWIFPAIVSLTQIGVVPGWSGIGFGFGAGYFTTLVYDLTRNKKFMKFMRVLLRRALVKIPFVKITEEDVDYIDRVTVNNVDITTTQFETLKVLREKKLTENTAKTPVVDPPSEDA